MYQHPLYALLLSLMVVIVIVESSIQQGKVLKTRLTISCLNSFIIALFWILSSAIKSDVFFTVFNIVMLIEYLLFGIIIFIISYTYLQKMRNYNNFIASFKNTTFNIYFLTDKKDRVKEISESLLTQFGLKREEIINKKFFDVIDKKIRFYKADDTDVNNEILKNYYIEYAKTITPNKETKRELYFYNTNGQSTILNLMENPIFFYGKYQGRMNVGQIKDDMSLLSVEKELVHKNSELETMQHKFIATLELTEDGLFFYDLIENYIWCNDTLVKILNLSSNSITTSSFHSNIHPDDLYVYKDKIDNLTPENPNYKVIYRFKTGYNYQYITERGKKIFENGKQNIVAFISKYESSYFAKTSYKHLDEVKSYDELVTDVNILYNNNMNFDLVTIRTTNLAEINNAHNRKIGDMILAAYVKEVKSNFVTESSDLYRVTGTDFVFTITDGRKIDFFRKCIESGNEMMNFKMSYGSTSVVLEINVGISQSYNDGKEAEELIANSKKALITSLNTKYAANYAYYKDVIND